MTNMEIILDPRVLPEHVRMKTLSSLTFEIALIAVYHIVTLLVLGEFVLGLD